ncbi:MAG: TA system antitoxin ParD family protein, partial [Burkholderiales bacterium]
MKRGFLLDSFSLNFSEPSPDFRRHYCCPRFLCNPATARGGWGQSERRGCHAGCHYLSPSLQCYYFCSKARFIMGMPVRIDDTLYEQARTEAQIERRTIAGQIEYWAMVGRAA